MGLRRLTVSVLALLIVGGMLQWGTAADSASTSSPSVNVFQEAQTVGALIEKLNMVANFTDSAIRSSHFSRSHDYTLAETYRRKALDEYRSREYSSATGDALRAMNYYRAVLSQLKGGELGPKGKAQSELLRLKPYLDSVFKLIEFAKSRGFDVTNVTYEYNQTMNAYLELRNDLRTGNLGELPTDLQTLEMRRALLEGALVRLRHSLMERMSVEIVDGFVLRGGTAINLARNLMGAASQRGVDVRMLQARLTSFERVYKRVLELKSAGDYGEALEVIRTNRGIITSFQTSVMYVRLRLETGEASRAGMGVQALVNETSARIREDGLSLEKLNERGVNTRIAELQLEVAVREFNTALMLYKMGRTVEAREHFLATRFLLGRVELFIRMHSPGRG